MGPGVGLGRELLKGVGLGPGLVALAEMLVKLMICLVDPGHDPVEGTLVAVRMELLGQLAVGGLDLAQGGAERQSQSVVGFLDLLGQGHGRFPIFGRLHLPPVVTIPVSRPVPNQA